MTIAEGLRIRAEMDAHLSIHDSNPDVGRMCALSVHFLLRRKGIDAAALKADEVDALAADYRRMFDTARRRVLSGGLA